MLPALFKAAGFHTEYISDQETYSSCSDWNLTTSSYLFDKKLNLFDACNDYTFEYDGDLVETYKRIRTRGSQPNFTIFHLIGQHIFAQFRYPPSYAYFTGDSIIRPDLTPGQRNDIAFYDNATRYNDFVVEEIIHLFRDEDAVIIYISDHGEEIYDSVIHYGRTFGEVLTPDVCRNQFEIPLLIWVSNRFREAHPDQTERIAQAVNRPVSIDNIPHTLLDLAQIRTAHFDRTRSFVNDQFNKDRPRFVNAVNNNKRMNYDEIMK